MDTLTWIVDWGPECGDTRYALIQHDGTESEVLRELDAMGDLTGVRVRELVIPPEGVDGMQYLEIRGFDPPVEGAHISDLFDDRVLIED